jgi:hypothetical protein
LAGHEGDQQGSISDVAGWLGVPYQTVVTWRYRHKRRPRAPWRPFPSPIPSPDSAARPRFWRSEVEAWARATGRDHNLTGDTPEARDERPAVA